MKMMLAMMMMMLAMMMTIIGILAGRLIVSWVAAKFSVSVFKMATYPHIHDGDCNNDDDDFVKDNDDFEDDIFQ